MVQARRGFSARAFRFCAAFEFERCGFAEPSERLALSTFGEDFTGKCKQASLGIAPGFGRQTCLSAGFFEELLAGQAVFGGHLRKKQPALGVATDEQAVTPDFDRFRGDRLQRGKQ